MWVQRLWLHQFRCHEAREMELAAGLSVILGRNGAGKTSVLEAIGYLATQRSFRGTPTEAMVRVGGASAVARAEVEHDGRTVLLEAEINPGGGHRMLLNKQPLRRTRDLRDALRISHFSPDDLALVKGGPADRRHYLDELLAALHPRYDALILDVERVLRQRNALLKQSGGRLTPEIGFTLDVWDDKLAVAGSALGRERVATLEALSPWLTEAYRDIADQVSPVSARYRSSWFDHETGLAGALAAARVDDIRRTVTTVGPHRDDVELCISGRPARTHASQGEQRTLALALRLAAHRYVTGQAGAAPVLLLDDVFSELDPRRSAALLHHLPPGQALLATATAVPCDARVDARVELTLDSWDKSVETVDEQRREDAR